VAVAEARPVWLPSPLTAPTVGELRVDPFWNTSRHSALGVGDGEPLSLAANTRPDTTVGCALLVTPLG
jgi:hypothetical protein